MNETSRRLARRCAILVSPTLLMLVACTPNTSNGNNKPQNGPNPSVTVTSAFPNLSGAEFDKSLRNGNNGLPRLGRLIAATQTGGPHELSVDLTGVQQMVGVYACRGDGTVTVQVKRGTSSLLKFWSDGCDPSQIYSGQSPSIPAGIDTAHLTITVPHATTYAFVLEEVETG